MKKRSYSDHLIVFENSVYLDSISGTKGSMRRIGEHEKKKAGDPKNEMSFDGWRPTPGKYEGMHPHRSGFCRLQYNLKTVCSGEDIQFGSLKVGALEPISYGVKGCLYGWILYNLLPRHIVDQAEIDRPAATPYLDRYRSLSRTVTRPFDANLQ